MSHEFNLRESVEQFTRIINKKLEEPMNRYYKESYIDVLRHFGVRHYEAESLLKRGSFESGMV